MKLVLVYFQAKYITDELKKNPTRSHCKKKSNQINRQTKTKLLKKPLAPRVFFFISAVF